MDGSEFKKLRNVQCEESFLGSIIYDNKLIVKAINAHVSTSDFSDKNNAMLYKSFIEIYERGNPIEIISIRKELDKCNIDIPTTSLVKYMNNSISANFDYYISEIKETAYRRHIYKKMNELCNDICSCDVSEIKSIVDATVKSIEMPLSDNLFIDASQVERVGLNDGLSTGFKSIDRLTNGLVYGSLTVLTGEPSSGKSTLLNQIVADNIRNNNRALIYSGELTNFNVLNWFMRTVADVSDLKEFTSKSGVYYDISSYGEKQIRSWIKNKLYIFNEESAASINNLVTSIEYLANTKNIKLVVIDNMMTVENSGAEELDKQKILAKRLKDIAKKYKIAVILVAHPKKKLQGDKKYHMHDVSGASEVVNLADYEFLLTRDIKTLSSGDVSDETHFAIMKNRITGKQGIKIKLNFDSIRKRFWIEQEELNRDYGYNSQDQIKFVELNDVEDVPF